MLSFSRDRAQVAYSEHDTLWPGPADGHRAQPIPVPGLRPYFPRWSPDGRNLAFTGEGRDGRDSVYTVPADHGSAKSVAPGAGITTDPDWSPGGSRIVLARVLNGPQDNSVLALAELDRGQLTDIPGSSNLHLPRSSQ